VEGDIPTLTSARYEIRKNFDQNRGLSSGNEDVGKKIAFAEEVAMFMRQNLVQGEQVDAVEERYKLRIHEHTERGDNEDIKKAGKGNSLAGVKCCSS